MKPGLIYHFHLNMLFKLLNVHKHKHAYIRIYTVYILLLMSVKKCFDVSLTFYCLVISCLLGLLLFVLLYAEAAISATPVCWGSRICYSSMLRQQDLLQQYAEAAICYTSMLRQQDLLHRYVEAAISATPVCWGSRICYSSMLRQQSATPVCWGSRICYSSMLRQQ